MELPILLPLTLIILFIAAVIIEIYLCEKWSPNYFNHGLVIYRKQLTVEESDDLNISSIEVKISKGIKLNKQPDGNIFFREWFFSWWPFLILMHGVITIKKNSITILGRLNLIPIALLILFILLELYGGKLNSNHLSGIFGLIFFFLIIYLIQRVRYNKIARLIEKEIKGTG